MRAHRAVSTRRAGFSLVELVVVMAILSVILGVVGLSLGGRKSEVRRGIDVERALSTLRVDAVMSSRPAAGTVVVGGVLHYVAAHPSGRLVWADQLRTLLPADSVGER